MIVLPSMQVMLLYVAQFDQVHPAFNWKQVMKAQNDRFDDPLKVHSLYECYCVFRTESVEWAEERWEVYRYSWEWGRNCSEEESVICTASGLLALLLYIAGGLHYLGCSKSLKKKKGYEALYL